MSEKYNGWNSYESWLFHLWLSNDEGDWDRWRSDAQDFLNDSDDRDAAIQSLAEALEGDLEENSPVKAGMYYDVIQSFIQEIDFQEVAEAIMEGLVSEQEEEDEDEDEDELQPEEGDYTTEDHCQFFQYGKLVLTVGEDADHRAVLRAHMDANQFWPSAWFVDDHGGVTLIDLSEEG